MVTLVSRIFSTHVGASQKQCPLSIFKKISLHIIYIIIIVVVLLLYVGIAYFINAVFKELLLSNDGFEES